MNFNFGVGEDLVVQGVLVVYVLVVVVIDYSGFYIYVFMEYMDVGGNKFYKYEWKLEKFYVYSD